MNIVALAGGVGGARLASGLASALPPSSLTIIVNTGDDFQHLGLWISPDLDTVCYTLAGIANPQTGWGRQDETWQALENLAALGGADWFRLGDRDLGTHLERTRRLRAGDRLSQITHDFCRAWGVTHRVLPMSDDPVPTRVFTVEGEMPFQEYFVKRRCEPAVTGFRFMGSEQAQPAPGVLEALQAADLAVICPSNPWVSIAPILAVPGIQAMIESQRVLAVSPIIAGQAVRGPAAKMYTELGIQPSALAVAEHYGNLLAGFVLDNQDAHLSASITALGIQPYLTDTLMKTEQDRRRLAQEVLDFGARLRDPHLT
jgi:LPPG:FO 2-phospho-L-lactate transferase